MKRNVAVLGASGMLGAMVLDLLAADGGLSVTATVRDPAGAETFRSCYPEVAWRTFDAGHADDAAVAAAIDGAGWIVNCIGVIKPYIRDDRPDEIERAIRVNALFPHLLAAAAGQAGSRVIQIATDCVYSGVQGGYAESALHDALDVYGKTKSLGEPYHDSVHSLRCSIIGPEPKGFVSLLEWFRRQPPNSSVNGFTNHQWNGITTLHYARICRGIIRQDLDLPRMQHIVPSGSLSKAEMLGSFATAYGRNDVTINPVAAKTVVDRTLATENQPLNGRIWHAAGYETPPSVPEMIEEMAACPCRWQGRRQ